MSFDAVSDFGQVSSNGFLCRIEKFIGVAENATLGNLCKGGNGHAVAVDFQRLNVFGISHRSSFLCFRDRWQGQGCRRF